MIIGNFAVAPELVTGGGIVYDHDAGRYKVFIERDGFPELSQLVIKETEAKDLLKKIEEAIAIGEQIRVEHELWMNAEEDE